MRILVTGASGFVASHLIPECAGDDVFGTSRSPAPPAGVMPDRYTPADLVTGDLERIVADAAPDVVYHLGAQASVARSWGDPAGTVRANVLGTTRLLEAVAARAPEATVLLVGSADVYGVQDREPIREDAPIRPQSPYAASKAAMEALGGAWRRGRGLRVLVTRSFAQLGPGQHSGFAIGDWASQIAAAERAGGGVVEAGTLDVVRDYIHVRDAVRAYVLIAQRGAPGAPYNVCSGVGRRLGDLLDRLLQRAAVPIDAIQGLRRPADIPSLIGDGGRLRALGWEPLESVEDGLDAILDERRANP